MKNCVYLITNRLNQQKYVGVAKDLHARMYQHSIGHDVEHSYLDRAIMKYGWENFEYIVLDHYQNDDERKQLEQYYIATLCTHRSQGGYNLTWGGDDACFPNVQGEYNPRAQFTEEDVRTIRQRRMNGERLSTVFEDYKDKVDGDKRAGFSKIWLHESWIDVCADFIGHYPTVDSSHFATIRKNDLSETDLEFIVKYFKWHGPVKYNTIYKEFKGIVDWETFQSICKQTVERLYGPKSTRRYRQSIGEIDRMVTNFRQELINEPKKS